MTLINNKYLLNIFTQFINICGYDHSCIAFIDTQTNAKVSYTVLYCNECKLGKTIPTLDDETLHKLHSTQYYRNGEGLRFVAPIEWLVEGMRRWRIHRLSKFVNKGRALDVGCGSGRFLRRLLHEGWEVAGLELNDDTAMAARNVHGLNVETSLDAFVDDSFDLITITHVLEHIRNPKQMLEDCFRLLKPGGVIAVAVPNIGSWQAHFTGGNWFHLDIPRHLWHFSEKWLNMELSKCGFQQIAIRRLDIAHNLFGWLQSLLNVVGIQHNRLYIFLGNDAIEIDNNNHYGSLIISLLLLPLLLPLSLILSMFEVLFHSSGTVEIIAQKK